MALGVDTDTHTYPHVSDFKEPGTCGRHAPGLNILHIETSLCCYHYYQPGQITEYPFTVLSL